MTRLKTKNGITLTSLVITVVILLILTTTIVINVNTGNDVKLLNNMRADIELLENKILSYYQKYGVIPVKGQPLTGVKEKIGDEISADDNDVYYEIDLAHLENLTLNLGAGETEDDIYIINERSHEVYYLAGIELERRYILCRYREYRRGRRSSGNRFT